MTYAARLTKLVVRFDEFVFFEWLVIRVATLALFCTPWLFFILGVALLESNRNSSFPIRNRQKCRFLGGNDVELN